MDFEMIAPGELTRYLNDPDAWIIDLRTPEEYAKCHVKGARSIPHDEIWQHGMFPMDVYLILYCERGSVSMSIARELAHQGYLVKTVVGGIHACPRKILERY